MWQRATRKQSQPPKGPQTYPSGTCIKIDDDYWYLKGEYKWKFISKRAVDSWRFAYIVEGSTENVSRYRHMGSLGFRDGTLLYCLKDAKLYVISESEKCPVVSANVLDRLGLKFNDAVTVGEDELNIHNKGDDLE